MTDSAVRRPRSPGERLAPVPRALAVLRRLCLSLPDVSEVQSWGHPNFRVGRKTFAAFEFLGGRPSIAVKVEAGLQEILIDGIRFFRTPYGGDHGWVSAWVDGTVDWPLLKDLVRRAHARMAPKGALHPQAGRTRGGRVRARRARAGDR